MVKSPFLHCWDCGFNSWLRKEDLTCLTAKNKNNHKVALVFWGNPESQDPGLLGRGYMSPSDRRRRQSQDYGG